MTNALPSYQKRQLVQRGFRALKTVAVFWALDRKPNIVETANEFSIENNELCDWMHHENAFAIVHIESGLLGYFRMKQIGTVDLNVDRNADLNVDRNAGIKLFTGLDFVNDDSGDPLFVPAHQMRTHMFPDGEYFIMAVPVGRVIVAYKGRLTLKMWY